jgi:hypothetical protein
MSTPVGTSSERMSLCKRGRRFWARSAARAGFLAVACGAILISGCNVTSGGLSSNTPPAGGGGLLSFVSVSMPDGISGRAYSKVAVTTVEAQDTTHYPISPALVSGTAPLATCTVSSGTLPPGMNPALTVDSTGAGCVISGTPSAADAGNSYTFTVQALDSNSPPRAAAQTFTLKIRPEFTVTAPPAVVGNVLPAGVQGRSYAQLPGNAAAFTTTTTLSATNGNGAVGAKNYCSLTVTPALASLSLTQVSASNNCQLQGASSLAAAGSYKVTIALTDTAIVDPETNLTAVPANTIAAASNASLNVAAPLKIAAQADAVSANPPTAVQGRAYGTGSGCSGGACLPLTYVASGGLPSVEPADSYLFSSTGLAAEGINCGATASSSSAKTTCSGTAGAPATTSFSVTLDDAGNLATPGGSASSTTSTISGLSLTVSPTLSLAVTPDPATNPAVQNRAYGIGIGCTGTGGNCIAPTYTPSGGIGAYSFGITGTPPAGISCAPNGGNTAVVCSGTASSTAASSTFAVSASDVANASTPSASTSPVSKTLTVDGALTLSPPASLLPAVSGRAFGTGAGCSGGNCVAAIFPITGGLGTYAANATIVTAPGTWICALTGSQYNCSSTAVGSGTSLSITANDGGSATTPGQTTAAASVALTVDPAMVLTPPATVNDAVTGRPYGTGSGCTGGSCVALQYSLTGGLGSYGAPTLTAGSNTFGCTGTATYNCFIAAVSGSGTQTLSMTIPDSSNASTPTANATDATKSITIQPKVTLADANLGTTWPAAVQNRGYAGSGFTADQITAANGIGAYTFSSSGLPTGLTCTPAGATDTCSATAVTGAPTNYSPQITVQDTGNASTPKATVGTDPSSQFTASLTVQAPLTLTAINTPLATAVNGRSYGTGNNCGGGSTTCQAAQFSVSGGLTYPASLTPSSAPGTWNCVLVGSVYNCSSSTVTATGPFPVASNVSLSLSDTANQTTPSGNLAPVSSSLTVNGPMTVAPLGTLPFPDAVSGRPYGAAGVCSPNPACQAIQYKASAGLGNYGLGTLAGGGSDAFTCLGTGTYSCSINTVAGSGSEILNMSVTESGNISAPGGLASDSTQSLTIRSAISLTPTIASPWPDAVNGRSYGSNGVALQFNATGGIQPYVSYTPSGLSPDFTCVVSTATSGTCSSASVSASAGDYNPSVEVVDTGNQSTPVATALTDHNSVATNSLHVDSALSINSVILPNGLLAYPYPTNSTAATLSTSGGLSGNTWIWPGDALSGACTATLTGTVPSGLTLNSSATNATITGTPSAASASAGQFSFQLCVTDTANSMTPAGFALPSTLGNNLIIDVITPYAVMTEADEVEFFNTLTKADSSVATQPVSTGAGSAPYGVAFSPSGRYAYVTLSGGSSNSLAIFDTITNAEAGSPISLTGCTAPHGVAATANLILVACNGSDNVAVVNVTNSGDTSTFSLGTAIATGSSGSQPEGVAISPDGSRAYVTLSHTNQLFAVAITGTTAVALSGTNPISLSNSAGTIPMGIAVALAGGSGPGTVAYIAKRGASLVAADGVEIITLTNDAFTDVSQIALSADSSTKPTYVAVTPDSTHVYVSLLESDQFAVFNNVTTTQITNSPFNLTTSSASPQGVAIPVVSGVLPGSNFWVFICQNATNNLALIDDKSAPAEDGSSPVAVAGTAPLGIAATPAPQ